MTVFDPVDFRGNTSFAWRHWGCVTPRIIENMKKNFDSATELDGFDELPAEDQAKVEKAWEEGHVADEDIPDSARKPEDEEDGEDEGKKKKAKGKASKKRPKVCIFILYGKPRLKFIFTKKDADEDDNDADEAEDDADEKPKKTTKRSKASFLINRPLYDLPICAS